MLTRAQYKALCRYKDAVVPKPSEGFNPVDVWLLDNELIQPASYSVGNQGGVITVLSDTYTISTKGIAALDEYIEHQRVKRRRIVWDIVIVLIGALAGALLQKFFGCG